VNAILDLFAQREDYSQYVLTGLLVFMRVVPITFLTPFLGGRLVPPETKTGISLVLTIVVYPIATAGVEGYFWPNPLVYLSLMFKELFIGFVLGFVASEVFYAMEIAGRMLDVMRGSNMAEVQVPELQLRASPLGGFLFQALVIVFIAIGGHRFFLMAFAESYILLPIDGWPAVRGDMGLFVDEILKYTNGLFAVAFALVFPGLFATFMTDIAFGMLNRVAPQLNAYFMAMGIKALAAIAFLFFALAMTFDRMRYLAEESILVVRDIIELMV